MKIVVVGAQWGDEGKGKMVDRLADEADLVVRFSGGANAGHTVVADGVTYKLHLVPSGIIVPGKVAVLGSGMVIDPAALFAELDELARQGVNWQGRVWVSDRAHLVLPTYKELDQEMETKRRVPIGTTGRGIGITYALKAHRDGVRVGDLFVSACWDNLRPVEKEFLAPYRERLKPMVTDLVAFMRRNAHKDVLFEGAQGVLLDLDYGTYPFVSSGYSAAGGAALGGGVGPRHLDKVFGVFKAYSTRVGNGPFPTEFSSGNPLGEKLREVGQEYGVTTGRARRTGFLDLVALRYACWTNSLDGLIATKMDVYDDFDEVQVCTGYKLAGQVIDDFPATVAELEAVEPVIKSFPGWKTALGSCRTWDSLPLKARDYLSFIESFTGTPIDIVSVGPDRDQTIVRKSPWTRSSF